MKFDFKKFGKNKFFFLICTLAVVIVLLLDLLVGVNKYSLDEEELKDQNITIGSLVINEVMTSNKGVITDEKGKLYDYVEIYNGNNHEINLKGYGLGDEGSTAKWAFPNTVVPAKGYVVVALSGTYQQGLYASFKLKHAGGEVLTLYKPNGKVADAVETLAFDSNMVMARNAEGKWVIQNSPTPGYSNNVEGHNKFLESLMSDEEKTIVINEFLPENRGNFRNESGEFSGYIEVKNISDKSVDLENYSLSNDENVSFKWQFPSIKLSKGEVLVVFTTGKASLSGELSTSFKLKNKNGAVVLANNKGKVIDRVKYEDLGNGLAYVRGNNSYAPSSALSPGFDNNDEGIKSFKKKYQKTPEGLIINEAMNSNYSYLTQNGGNHYDWIELYNNSNKTIQLSEYCLTTSINDLCSYKLPEFELEKGKYYIVIASGDVNLSNDSYKHAGFKLSETESIYLTSSGKVVDTLFLHDIPKGYSFGKDTKFGTYYYGSPTPGSNNSGGAEAVASMPKASVDSGIFNDSKGFEVTLSGNGNIYYTLDGSTPTTSSKLYSSPLTIQKTTVLRIMSHEDGKLNSDTNTYNYIVNENHKIAVVSLAINAADFKKINNNPGTNNVRPVAAEMLNPDGSGFKIDAGLKLFGGSTRYYRKKSYELKFKKQFGPAELHYKVFDTVDSAVYNSLILRTGSQDEFQWSKRNMLRDIVSTSLMHDYTKVDVQAYKPCVVYVNGTYWGLYFLREKIDETLIANHYNVPATKENTDIIRIDGEVKTGNKSKYNEMVNFLKKNNMSNASNYAKAKEMIDIENFCDFWIGEIFATNYDMLNLRYMRNPDVDGGKFKLVFYDMDSAYYNVTNDYFTFYGRSAGIGMGNWSNPVYVNLMKNQEFKETFVTRLSYNMNNTWKYENFEKKIDSVIAEIGEDEIKRNLSRWNNISYSQWQKNVSEFKKYAKQRPSIMIKQAKSYFKLSDADIKKFFGGL